MTFRIQTTKYSKTQKRTQLLRSQRNNCQTFTACQIQKRLCDIWFHFVYFVVPNELSHLTLEPNQEILT